MMRSSALFALHGFHHVKIAHDTVGDLLNRPSHQTATRTVKITDRDARERRRRRSDPITMS
jgi:hypothetical protein